MALGSEAMCKVGKYSGIIRTVWLKYCATLHAASKKDSAHEPQRARLHDRCARHPCV